MLKMSNFFYGAPWSATTRISSSATPGAPSRSTSPTLQRDAAADALVVDERAVGAVVVDDGLAVAALERAVRTRHAGDAGRQRSAHARPAPTDQPSVSGTAVIGQARPRNSTCVGTAVGRHRESSAWSTVSVERWRIGQRQPMHQRDRVRPAARWRRAHAARRAPAAPCAQLDDRRSRAARRAAPTRPGMRGHARREAQVQRRAPGGRAACTSRRTVVAERVRRPRRAARA